MSKKKEIEKRAKYAAEASLVAFNMGVAAANQVISEAAQVEVAVLSSLFLLIDAGATELGKSLIAARHEQISGVACVGCDGCANG